MTDADAPSSFAGRLLVASPQLADPNFFRAVILMLEHNEEGALGLVLNQPTSLAASDVLPEELTQGLPLDDRVYTGGPVSPDAVIMIGEFPDDDEQAAFGGVGVIDPQADIEALARRVRHVRVFGGYAGWSPGQLEEELAQDAWIEAPPELADVFTERPSELWSTVLERKGGQYALVARMPVDPSLN
jgi:putative transcriptional regulator